MIEEKQSKLLVKALCLMTAIACILHIVIGTHPIVVCIAGLNVLLFAYPIYVCGFLNIGAVLIAMVGFRYTGFPIFAKLIMIQPLDTNLLDPLGSFGVVLLGLIGYLIAFHTSIKFSIGKPLLKPTINESSLRRISFLSAIIGISANLAVASRTGEHYTGLTIAEFFTPFLHLALISSIGQTLLASNKKRSLDFWGLLLAFAEIVFAMVQNSRLALMETFLCFIATSIAFEAKIKWHQLFAIIITIGMMVLFVTPIFLYVRDFRSDLSWNQRIFATFETVGKWSNAFSYYQNKRDLSDRLGWYLNYYGKPHNVFERMTLINHVDVLKVGVDTYGHVGINDLSLSIKKSLPRILSPDKPIANSQGTWLYEQIGLYKISSFATAPLIGTGYSAYGKIGAFFYPLILGTVWFLMIKKISGWRLQGNVWAIYLLLRIHNQFVEGSSDSYLVHILRIMPQDIVLLLIINALSQGRFIHPIKRKLFDVYNG